MKEAHYQKMKAAKIVCLDYSEQMLAQAMASPAAKPNMLAPMPKSAPIDEMASERWCHASAIKALEFSTRAQWRVYQNMPSLTTMDKTAAASATIVRALAEA